MKNVGSEDLSAVVDQTFSFTPTVCLPIGVFMFTQQAFCLQVEFFYFLTFDCLKMSILHLCRIAFPQNHI